MSYTVAQTVIRSHWHLNIDISRTHMVGVMSEFLNAPHFCVFYLLVGKAISYSWDFITTVQIAPGFPCGVSFFFSLLSSVSQCLPYLAPAEICPVILIMRDQGKFGCFYNMLFYTSCSNNLFHSFGQLLCSLPLASQVFMSELDIQIPTAFGMIVIVFCFSVALGLQACNAWNTSNLL